MENTVRNLFSSSTPFRREKRFATADGLEGEEIAADVESLKEKAVAF